MNGVITELGLCSPTGSLWFRSKAALAALGFPQHFVHVLYILYGMSSRIVLLLPSPLFTWQIFKALKVYLLFKSVLHLAQKILDAQMNQ